MKVANKKLELSILRQLPSLFYQNRTLFGIKFDRVAIVQNKLIIELANMFEAVFVLNFKATGYETMGILQLYDYRVLNPELKDKFHTHGFEFKLNEQKQAASAAETRALRKARENKQKTIGNIAYKMLVKALDDVGMNPDGTLKEGFTAPTGTMTSGHLELGLQMLLKQAMALNILAFRT